MVGKYTVLAVDDSRLVCQTIEASLQNDDILFYKAYTGKEALNIHEAVKPDLILLDISLPDMDGYEVLRGMKANGSINASIIFITFKDSEGDVVKGFSMGACDYIKKPFQPDEMRSRVLTHLNAKKQRDMLLNMNEALLADMEKLNFIAFQDELTGLRNRRFACEKLAEDLKKGEDNVVLAIVDIDDFKKVNDTYGHEMGDYVLANISHIMEDLCGKHNVIRWGGEEFLIILRNTDLELGRMILEQIRQEVEQRPFVCDNIKFTCTITFGMIEYDRKEDLKGNMANADRALYQGKALGKNQVVCYESMSDLTEKEKAAGSNG